MNDEINNRMSAVDLMLGGGIRFLIVTGVFVASSNST